MAVKHINFVYANHRHKNKIVDLTKMKVRLYRLRNQDRLTNGLCTLWLVVCFMFLPALLRSFSFILNTKKYISCWILLKTVWLWPLKILHLYGWAKKILGGPDPLIEPPLLTTQAVENYFPILALTRSSSNLFGQPSLSLCLITYSVFWYQINLGSVLTFWIYNFAQMFLCYHNVNFVT